MPEYVRVRDKASGHELSVIAPIGPGYDVLDEPATHRNGVPLPPKHKSPAPAPSKKKSGHQADQPGQQADTPKEND